MTIGFCRRVDSAFVAADEKTAEIMSKIPRAELIKVEFTRPRNLAFHRRVFVFLHLLFENQELYTEFEDFRATFLVASGYCNITQNFAGLTVAVPKSMSFSKLDQAGMEALWQRFCEVAITRIIPNLNLADLEKEIRDLVGV